MSYPTNSHLINALLRRNRSFTVGVPPIVIPPIDPPIDPVVPVDPVTPIVNTKVLSISNWLTPTVPLSNYVFPQTIVGYEKSLSLKITANSNLTIVSLPSAVGQYIIDYSINGVEVSAPLTLTSSMVLKADIVFAPTVARTNNNSALSFPIYGSVEKTIQLSGISIVDPDIIIVPPPVEPPPPVVSTLTYLTADGGKLRENSGAGDVHVLRSINWYGFEQTGVPGGVWTRPFRTKSINGIVKEGMLDEIKRLGFNSIRLLFSQDCTWPGYKPVTTPGSWNSTYIHTEANPEFLNSLLPQNPQDVKSTIEIMDIFVGWCESLNIRIIFDMHALAPDNDNVLATLGKWYTTPTPTSPGQTAGIRREQRNEQQAIDALVFLANRYKNRPVVAGFDLINEPHNCVWDRNPTNGVLGFYERAGAAIQAVNPNVLLICEGHTGNIDQTPAGFEDTVESQTGLYAWSTWWSGKLDEARNNLVTVPVPNKVVYSPHEYGSWLQGVSLQPWFDPVERVGANYAGLPFPQNMPEVWRRQWGYLTEENIAPVWIGEFGSYFRIGGDPITGGGATYNQRNLDLDAEWMAALSTYCNTHKIGFAYWAWNPAGDPDGLVGQQPVGTWNSAQAFKLGYLAPFIQPTDVDVIIPPVVDVGGLSVSGSVINFGEIANNINAVQGIQITNSTIATIVVNISVTGIGFVTDFSSVTVPASGTVSVSVTFSPLVDATYTGTLNINYGSNNNLSVNLLGNSVTTIVVIPTPTFTPIVLAQSASLYGITAVGDSLTEGGLYFNNGWLSKACFYGNQYLRFRGTFAVSGSTAEQALNLQLPSVLAMNPKPKACVVATGTNSVYDGTASTERVKDICNILIANNIYPILWTIPPRNDQASVDHLVEAWNNIIRDYHFAQGIPLMDAFEALRLPNSYRAPPAYMNPDGLHFTDYGYTVLGRYAIDSGAFKDVPTDGKLPLATGVSGANAATNPLFLGTGEIATGLTIPSGFVGSLLPSSDSGNWQRITRNVGTSGTPSVASTFQLFTVTPGQKHNIACKVRWNTAGVRGEINMIGAAWQTAMMLMMTDENWGNYPNSLVVVMGPQGDHTEEGTFYAEFTPPAGANRLNVSLMALAAAVEINTLPFSIDYSQLTIVGGGGFAKNNIAPVPVPWNV